MDPTTVIEDVSKRGLMEALLVGETLGYDDGGHRWVRGHRRVLITIGYTEIVRVIDEEAKLVLTLWTR